jgi:hypothetical protein
VVDLDGYETVSCRLAIQVCVGKTSSGRPSHRTFSIKGIKPGADIAVLASLVRDAIAPLLAYPVTKARLVTKKIRVLRIAAVGAQRDPKCANLICTGGADLRVCPPVSLPLIGRTCRFAPTVYLREASTRNMRARGIGRTRRFAPTSGPEGHMTGRMPVPFSMLRPFSGKGASSYLSLLGKSP